MKYHLVPSAMGLIMGPMLLWMLHGQLTDTAASTVTLRIFVLAHLLLLLLVAGGGLFAARLFPSLRGRLSRLHRPSRGHLGRMLATAGIAALTLHVVIHGFA